MKNKKLFYGLLVFVISLIVYILTCAPGVTFTDSGELAGACTTLGISHPSGYPLFAILGHLVTKLPLPFSNIYKLNLFAGFATAASAFIFFNTLVLIFSKFRIPAVESKNSKQLELGSTGFPESKILLSAFAGALTYSFANTVWAQATSIEVYSLHLTMINSVIFSAINYYFAEKKKFEWGALTSLLLGLSFTNHLTTVLLLPGLIFIMFKSQNRGFDFNASKFKEFALFLIPLFIGLSLYLYLPLRSSAEPLFNWGFVSRGFDKFLYHLQGKQYQVWMFSGPEVISKNFNKFLIAFPYQYLLLLLVPMISGFTYYKRYGNVMKAVLAGVFGTFTFPFIRFYQENKGLLGFFVILIFSCLIYSLNYSIHDIESYFLLAYISFIVIFSVSILYLPIKNSAFALVIIIPLASLLINYSDNDVSKDYTVEEYTKTVCESLAPNAIIISAQWDFWVSAFWYKQRIEGYRSDVSLFEKELARRTWYRSQFAKWEPIISKAVSDKYDAFMNDLELFESGKPYDAASIQGNYLKLVNGIIDYGFASGRPVYITLDVLETEPGIGSAYEKVPQGFVFRLYNDSTIKDFNLKSINLDKFLSSCKNRKEELYEASIRNAYTNIFNNARYFAITRNFGKAREAINLAKKINEVEPGAYELEQELDRIERGK